MTGRRMGRRALTAVGIVGGIGVALAAGSGWAVGGEAARNGVQYGDPVPMGDGTARVYIELRDGAPVELGIALSEDAMSGLPTHHTPGGLELEPGHMMFFETPPMPATNPTPFRSVLLGWNPGGHEPPGVYDVPHFDFHFFTEEESFWRAIDRADPEFDAKAARHPSGAYAPEGYFAIPGGVPMMGTHWVDPSTPELNGQPFTKTLLFGSWDGKLTFVEPMITKAYLETRPDYAQPLPIPASDEAGWRPGGYRIRFDPVAREWRIALTDFVWREPGS